MSLDDLAAISVTSLGNAWGPKHHGRHTHFHSDRSGERKPHRPREDCPVGGDPVDWINLGGGTISRHVVPQGVAVGRGDQPCTA